MYILNRRPTSIYDAVLFVVFFGVAALIPKGLTLPNSYARQMNRSFFITLIAIFATRRNREKTSLSPGRSRASTEYRTALYLPFEQFNAFFVFICHVLNSLQKMGPKPGNRVCYVPSGKMASVAAL